jgi:hypothetical protein
MGASQVPATTGSDNWVLISSVTPTASASTLSFTSISGYKKLLLSVRSPGSSAPATYNLTFNSDTGTNYIYTIQLWSASTGSTSFTSGYPSSATNINFGSHTSGNLATHLIFNDTNTSGMKNISGYMMGGAGTNIIYAVQGAYFGSSSISTVTLTLTGGTTFAATGTVALYGVA